MLRAETAEVHVQECQVMVGLRWLGDLTPVGARRQLRGGIDTPAANACTCASGAAACADTTICPAACANRFSAVAAWELAAEAWRRRASMREQFIICEDLHCSPWRGGVELSQTQGAHLLQFKSAMVQP
jgi:hypothetical protein